MRELSQMRGVSENNEDADLQFFKEQRFALQQKTKVIDHVE